MGRRRVIMLAGMVFLASLVLARAEEEENVAGTIDETVEETEATEGGGDDSPEPEKPYAQNIADLDEISRALGKLRDYLNHNFPKLLDDSFHVPGDALTSEEVPGGGTVYALTEEHRAELARLEASLRQTELQEYFPSQPGNVCWPNSRYDWRCRDRKVQGIYDALSALQGVQSSDEQAQLFGRSPQQMALTRVQGQVGDLQTKVEDLFWESKRERRMYESWQQPPEPMSLGEIVVGVVRGYAEARRRQELGWRYGIGRR